MTKKTLLIYLIAFVSFFVQSNYSIDQETAIAKINGISIAYVTAGEKDNPPVLMIMGLNSNLKRWPPELIDGLVKQNLYVITYDNRDTGKSTWITQESSILKFLKFMPTRIQEVIVNWFFDQMTPYHLNHCLLKF